MDEIFSIKNTFVKKFGNKVYEYINQSKPTDIKFLKYYSMKNTNFFFSPNLENDFLYKTLVFLDPIFLKNIFFYYKNYFTIQEIELLCNNVNMEIYVYIVEQYLPEKGSRDRVHLINRYNFLLPLFFHSTTIEFYSNARCIFKHDIELIRFIKKFNKKSFLEKQSLLINRNFNLYTLGLVNKIILKTANNSELIFNGNYHYYFFGIKIVDYPFFLNKTINSFPNINSIYHVVLYFTKLRLNKEFYTINEDFINDVKKMWKGMIRNLSNKEISKLKKLTNYNKDFLIKLFD